jgi:hypothetical protein
MQLISRVNLNVAESSRLEFEHRLSFPNWPNDMEWLQIFDALLNDKVAVDENNIQRKFHKPRVNIIARVDPHRCIHGQRGMT